MSTGDRGVKRVGETVKTLTEKVNKECDEVADEMVKVVDETLNKVHKVKTSIVNPLKDAQKDLDDLLGDNIFETEDEDVVSPFAVPSSKPE